MQAVEAVKTQAEVELVERKLAKNAKGNRLYADIWRIGVNMALRIGDLLSIEYSQVQGDTLSIREEKTGKVRVIKINEQARKIIDRRRQDHPQHRFLFEVESNRAKGKAVSRFAVSKAFKDVGEELDIHLNTHSMRKTRGWVLHQAGVRIEMIAKVLNHSSPAVTMAYIGLDGAQIAETYDTFII